jgi:cell division protease FtsH
MAARATSPFVEKEYDELDRKIDGFLGKLGTIFRVLVVLGAIIGFIVFVFIPNIETWGPILGFVFMMVFQLFFAVFFIIIQFVAMFWFLGRTRIYWIMPGETGVGFKDYKGNPEIIELAERVVTLLRGVKGFKEMGGQVHRGMLLAGPPGTGKSYLAQCIASEAGIPFAYASSPSFQSMFMGIGNIKVMMLYSKARKMARKYGACIIFMDEIDAIGMSRARKGGPGMMGGFMGFGGGSTGLLNELLMQMDPPPTDQSWRARMLRKFGWRTKKAEMPPVFTMGATNLVETLDAALLRPGRFDWKIQVERPSYEGRLEVLDYYLAKVKAVPNLPVERIATEMITPEGQGYSPVEIKFVVNEAVVHAHFDNREAITYEDIRHAMETREYGLRQRISGRTFEDKRRVAYHEAGHAIAMLRLYTRKRLDRLTLMQGEGRDPHHHQGRAADRHPDLPGEQGSRDRLPGHRDERHGRRPPWRELPGPPVRSLWHGRPVVHHVERDADPARAAAGRAGDAAAVPGGAAARGEEQAARARHCRGAAGEGRAARRRGRGDRCARGCRGRAVQWSHHRSADAGAARSGPDVCPGAADRDASDPDRCGGGHRSVRWRASTFRAAC